MKEAARGTAALASLPSREELGGSYFELRDRIDQIATQAEKQGSLKVALAGLNSVRHTIDSIARLSGFDRSGTQVNVAVATNVEVDLGELKERLIEAFDGEPEVKARIARTLLAAGSVTPPPGCEAATADDDRRETVCEPLSPNRVRGEAGHEQS